MLEAMAAGLPVIASGLAAHRDILSHRHTGWLVDSPEELHEAVVALEIPEKNLETGRVARAWIKERIGTWDDCAAQYASAYQRLSEHAR